jgi:hypothetical protein
MVRAARFALVVAAIVVCFWVSTAYPVEPRSHKMWEDVHPFEIKPYKMQEDYSLEPLYDCALQYYYYIPCPTYSWFWGVYGWKPGDILGASFRIGDTGTGGCDPCDPWCCTALEYIRILDLAGYGSIYPGIFTIEMDVWCSDASMNPFKHIWNSGPLETGFGWNYIETPGLHGLPIVDCYDSDLEYPSIIVTMTCTGTNGVYPMVGFDNVGTAVRTGCQMHDSGCLPVQYPRDAAGNAAPSVRSGYVGRYCFEHWPPLGIPDGDHARQQAMSFNGFAEVAWRIYLESHCPCLSPAGVQGTTWSGIKSLYR